MTQRLLLPPASVTATACVPHISERSLGHSPALDAQCMRQVHDPCSEAVKRSKEEAWPRGFPRLHGAFKVGRLGNPGPHKASGFSDSGYLHFWELAVLWKERNEKQNPFGPQHYPPFLLSSAESLKSQAPQPPWGHWLGQDSGSGEDTASETSSISFQHPL